jgi:hypothetical protein
MSLPGWLVVFVLCPYEYNLANPNVRCDRLFTKVNFLFHLATLGTEDWVINFTNYQLPITNYQLPITNHQSPIPHNSCIVKMVGNNAANIVYLGNFRD